MILASTHLDDVDGVSGSTRLNGSDVPILVRWRLSEVFVAMMAVGEVDTCRKRVAIPELVHFTHALQRLSLHSTPMSVISIHLHLLLTANLSEK